MKTNILKQFISGTLLVLLFTAFHSESFAQACTPPGDDIHAVYDRLTLDAADVYSYSDVTSGVPGTYYELKCGVNPITLTASFDISSVFDKEVYFDVNAQTFDCSGNYTSGIVTLFSTPVNYHWASPSTLRTESIVIEAKPNTAYHVVFHVRNKVLGIWGRWNHASSNLLRFIKPSITPPNPSGSFSNVLSTVSRTSTGTGWTVDVHQLDATAPSFDFNATPTTCEDNWSYSISKFDLNSWTGSNTIASGTIDGQAGNIDMDAFYTHGINPGNLYLLKLVAGYGYFPKYYWFEIKNAQIGGSISSTESVVESVGIFGGGFLYYLLERRCQYSQMLLKTNGTESAVKYKISVQTVNTTYSPFGPVQTTGWQPGPVASSYSLGSMFGPFPVGQRYKVTYEVGDPQQSKVFYFMYIPPCTAEKEPDNFRPLKLKPNRNPDLSDESTSENEAIALYPNPTNGKFYVDFAGEIAEQTSIEIIDLKGRVVFKSNTVNSNKMEFDLSNKSDGIYFARIINSNEVKTMKIIKR